MAESRAAFEPLYHRYKDVLERYIVYKISNRQDAQDVLQETLTAAYNGFSSLSDVSMFKRWLLGIASNKCKDYYALKAKRLEIPTDTLPESRLDAHGYPMMTTVQDALDALPEKEMQILYLHYFLGYNQRDIALRLGVPLGTVKSRIHTAKAHFRQLYPIVPDSKRGERSMKTRHFPQKAPKITIEKAYASPFSVDLEEISGWLIVPRVGERNEFAFYNDPDGGLTSHMTMDCVREAQIHGIPCVQVECEETYLEGDGTERVSTRTLFLRLTDTHVTYIAEMAIRDGALHFGSFMDEEWLASFETGEDNSGRAIRQQPKGIALIKDDGSITISREEYADVLGRYTVSIADESYDTVAIAELCEGIYNVLYVTEDGRTKLMRRYNRFDWKQERYNALWTDTLPDSERLSINGDVYVHWYDCLPKGVL